MTDVWARNGPWPKNEKTPQVEKLQGLVNLGSSTWARTGLTVGQSFASAGPAKSGKLGCSLSNISRSKTLGW